MVKVILLIVPILLFSQEPIVPIPKKINYNAKKAHLGKVLFLTQPSLQIKKSVVPAVTIQIMAAPIHVLSPSESMAKKEKSMHLPSIMQYSISDSFETAEPRI